ncbi:sensor domain-containing diguanylate cyclase [Thalassotalea atypica]|uniref:sensor domain-containing diguanylate cyclase n=1 Tax=Thalassotalea atypica TaxID=2054316 RepID=UPI00257243D8|nr:diguanylate cyclase [Thalassotalea atypica]
MEKHIGMSAVQERVLYPLLFAVTLGIIGALLNTLSFPFLPQVQLIFGNAAFVIVAMRLKPSYALISALIAATPLYFIWGHPFGFITFGLEALVISYARSKGVYIFFADIFYWLIIGMPLSALFIWLNNPQGDVYWVFITLKQGFNAILYTTIATLLAFFIDRYTKFGWEQQPNIVRSLRKQLIHSIVLITTFAVVASTLFISQGVIQYSQRNMVSILENSAVRYANVANLYIDNQIKVIQNTSRILSDQPLAQQQHVLNNVQQEFSGFITMLVADSSGKVTAASPDKLQTLIQTTDTWVTDRPYFIEAMKSQALYMSDVFQGRGFGDDIIVAISAPIYQDGNISGIIEGSIDLGQINELTTLIFENKHVNLVVTDHKDKVIFSSEGLSLVPLEPFTFEKVDDASTHPRLRINNSTGEEYAFIVKQLDTGWHVYSLINYDVTIAEIEREYMVIFVSLMITLIFASIIANLFGRRLTRSLNFIIKQIRKYDDDQIEQFQPLYLDASIEVKELYNEFKANKAEMAKYQLHLEEQVKIRTGELNSANEKLKSLALVDSLTQVNNRRFLDTNFTYIQKSAQRNTALMAVVMLDLDHFKVLNDTYGHLAGDECLIKIAGLLRDEFSRETDCVVRFGGEEFLIVVPYVTVAAIKQKLDALRQHIEHQQFTDSEGQSFSVTASFGALIADADFSTDVIKWVKIADRCLYQAKDNGRNTIVIEDKISRAN